MSFLQALSVGNLIMATLCVLGTFFGLQPPPFWVVIVGWIIIDAVVVAIAFFNVKDDHDQD